MESKEHILYVQHCLDTIKDIKEYTNLLAPQIHYAAQGLHEQFETIALSYTHAADVSVQSKTIVPNDQHSNEIKTLEKITERTNTRLNPPIINTRIMREERQVVRSSSVPLSLQIKTSSNIVLKRND